MNAKMSQDGVLEPPQSFVDPRKKRGFELEHWPTCDGQPAPCQGASDLHSRRCIEFLAAYYELNVLNARLLKVQKKSAPKKDLRTILSALNRAAKALEKLEDRYAPVGFFGEPTMAGIFYSDITFVRPELPRIYPAASSQSSYVAIPGLEEIPPSELRGRVRILRFGHGTRKVGI